MTTRTETPTVLDLQRICAFADCDRQIVARGLCPTHHKQRRRGMELAPIKGHLPWPDRFWAKVDKTDGCWLWMAARQRDGYGSIALGRSSILAHRMAYELAVGPIPDGLTLDHLCRVRHCVNPAHLEPVTNAVNVSRGISPSAQHSQQTHCKRGHEFTPENTRRRPSRPSRRICRTCEIEHTNPSRRKATAA